MTTTQDTARVVALLPWGERLEMQRSRSRADRFFARIPIPSGGAAGASVVKFIITDRAHNRTTMLVDVS
jgi:hypothetical protein